MSLLKRSRNKNWLIFTLAITILSGSFSSLFAQKQLSTAGKDVPLSLNEALEIALVNSYVLQKSRLGVDEAEAQIREARGTVYPQIGGQGSYTRNVITPNPFAGSSAEGLFSSFGAIDWLFYNEQQRSDGNPTLNFSDFLDRQEEGLRAAGIEQSAGGNPFAVENQFILGVSATQALYNGAAFAAIRGAEHLRTIMREQLERDTQTLVKDVRSAYLNALLAQEQVNLLESSLNQLRETHREITLMVDQGVLPRIDRNSLEVEIVNLETNLISAKNGAALAVRSLNLTLGISIEHDIVLTNSFEDFTTELPEIGKIEDAYPMALQLRPDLKQLDGAIKLRQEERNLNRAAYLPVLSAFADYAFIGSVPQNRTLSVADPDVDFKYNKETRGFFDTSYWNASLAVGLRLQWSIFDGFQRRARLQQVDVNIRRTEIDAIMLREAIYLEIDQSLKNVESAWQRIESQRRNIQLADMNYSDAKSRLREGAGTRLEERQAANLLDQSKLNYLAALHEFLIARSAFDHALGIKTVEVQIND
ncbi:MAG TPA: TolC family protein [Bacteroidetes bacterium]|nr:TolC family protein [Bacteroidota bacterium]